MNALVSRLATLSTVILRVESAADHRVAGKLFYCGVFDYEVPGSSIPSLYAAWLGPDRPNFSQFYISVVEDGSATPLTDDPRNEFQRKDQRRAAMLAAAKRQQEIERRRAAEEAAKANEARERELQRVRNEEATRERREAREREAREAEALIGRVRGAPRVKPAPGIL